MLGLSQESLTVTNKKGTAVLLAVVLHVKTKVCLASKIPQLEVEGPRVVSGSGGVRATGIQVLKEY